MSDNAADPIFLTEYCILLSIILHIVIVQDVYPVPLKEIPHIAAVVHLPFSK